MANESAQYLEDVKVKKILPSCKTMEKSSSLSRLNYDIYDAHQRSVDRLEAARALRRQLELASRRNHASASDLPAIDSTSASSRPLSTASLARDDQRSSHHADRFSSLVPPKSSEDVGQRRRQERSKYHSDTEYASRLTGYKPVVPDETGTRNQTPNGKESGVMKSISYGTTLSKWEGLSTSTDHMAVPPTIQSHLIPTTSDDPGSSGRRDRLMSRWNTDEHLPSIINGKSLSSSSSSSSSPLSSMQSTTYRQRNEVPTGSVSSLREKYEKSCSGSNAIEILPNVRRFDKTSSLKAPTHLSPKNNVLTTSSSITRLTTKTGSEQNLSSGFQKKSFRDTEYSSNRLETSPKLGKKLVANNRTFPILVSANSGVATPATISRDTNSTTKDKEQQPSSLKLFSGNTEKKETENTNLQLPPLAFQTDIRTQNQKENRKDNFGDTWRNKKYDILTKINALEQKKTNVSAVNSRWEHTKGVPRLENSPQSVITKTDRLLAKYNSTENLDPKPSDGYFYKSVDGLDNMSRKEEPSEFLDSFGYTPRRFNEHDTRRKSEDLSQRHREHSRHQGPVGRKMSWNESSCTFEIADQSGNIDGVDDTDQLDEVTDLQTTSDFHREKKRFSSSVSKDNSSKNDSNEELNNGDKKDNVMSKEDSSLSKMPNGHRRFEETDQLFTPLKTPHSTHLTASEDWEEKLQSGTTLNFGTNIKSKQATNENSLCNPDYSKVLERSETASSAPSTDPHLQQEEIKIPSEVGSNSTGIPITWQSGDIDEVEIEKGINGVGFSIEGGIESAAGDRPITVRRIFKGDGTIQRILGIGDELISANDHDLTKLSQYAAWNLLKSLPDGQVKLKVRRK